MTRFQTQFASAFAAVLIVALSFGAIVTVPPAQAHAVQAPGLPALA